MRPAKRRMLTLLSCLVLSVIATGVINGQKKEDDIGETIAIIYPDDAELSARILAKYIDLKHILPYYSLIAQQEQLESARRLLQAVEQELASAEDVARDAQLRLDEALRGKTLSSAGVVEARAGKPKPPAPKVKPEVAVPDPEITPMPAQLPGRQPPRQVTIHPYRLKEAALEIAKHFTEKQLVDHWPK